MVRSQTVVDPLLRVREVAVGLSAPTAMAFIGTDDILVLQKNDGRVRRVTNGVVQPGQVLDVAVDNDSERGLLGLALDPSFPAAPFVFLYYTESSTTSDTGGTPGPVANRVYRYTWNGSALVSPTPILNLPVTPGPNHDGGVIKFGPDGKLYVIIGDLNRNGQLQNNAAGPSPDDTSVILRINSDGATPSDNPFFSQGGNLAKYYAHGIRNSFGMAFDPLTGKLWDTENGPDSYDEINLVEPGFNSGWNMIMGPDARDPQGVSDLISFPGSTYADPKFSWLTPVGPTAITFLNSSRLGIDYHNDAFVGDIRNGNVYRFKVNSARNGFDFSASVLADLVADSVGELAEVVIGTGFGGITDLKVGPDGGLYILSYVHGKIYVVTAKFVPVDFDGDRIADRAIFRDGLWYYFGSTNSALASAGLGTSGDLPVAADYDGDGKTDRAIFRNGIWYHIQSSNGALIQTGLGGAGDVPVPGDYDGDGKADQAIFRSGLWYNWQSSDGALVQVGLGTTGDVPVPADYDGDGKTDRAIFRNGIWYYLQSSNGALIQVGLGTAGDVPVPADYDGDGKADPALFRNGIWYIRQSTNGALVQVGLGTPGDIAVPADYDGDGKADQAIYRNGIFWIRQSSNGQIVARGLGGLPQDVPVR